MHWTRWIWVLAFLVPEVLLKARSHQQALEGSLELQLPQQHLRIEWGYHLNQGSAVGFWFPSVQRALGPHGSTLMICLGVLFSAFFVLWAQNRVASTCGHWGLLFLVAGGAGNLVDRLSVGGVIDYWLLQLQGVINTSFYWNLSDLYIDIAIFLLLLAVARGDLDDSDTTDSGDSSELQGEKKQQ
ncbi:unnamed protein product [Effrenium voratum]|nr:unnamed protein product [Effrenium voratum]